MTDAIFQTDTHATEPIVRTDGLRKAYGRHVALESLDLVVRRGQVVGLLGPNGAGKTTAVKLLLGLSRPSGGTGTVLGAPLGDRGVRRSVGYLPEMFRYPPWLSARELIELHCQLAGLPRRSWRGWTDRSLDLVGLADRARGRVGDFSKGMQQRLGLGLALLGDPQLVILDEPTSALDPVGREDVRAIIRATRARGASVILNSHLLGEVERICDEVVVIHRGRVIAAGGLRQLLGAPSLRISVSGLADPVGLLRSFAPATLETGHVLLHPIEPERTPDVVDAVVRAGGRVHAVEPVQRSLEDLFLQLVRTGATATPAVVRAPEPVVLVDPEGPSVSIDPPPVGTEAGGS